MLKIALCEDNKIQHNQIVSFIETISMPKHTLDSFYKGNDLFTSIQEAMINKEPYDVVIMDIDLPDGNGIKFSKKINVFSPHTIIIYMTSYEDYVSIQNISILFLRRIIRSIYHMLYHLHMKY